MRSNQLEDKRNKFLKQIRYRHHQQYFDLHRQRQAAQLPALAYLPILLQNQLYDDLALIMDCISITEDSEMDPKIIKQIQQRCQHHTDQKVRKLMFILKNRTGRWGNKQIRKAINCIIQGNQTFIKQLAIYLQTKYHLITKNYTSLQQKTSQKQQKANNLKNSQQYNNYCQQLKQIFNSILKIHPKIPQNRLCWLDIICRTLELNITSISECLVNNTIDSFLLAIDIGVNNSNQFQLVRVLKIIGMLIDCDEYAKYVINMQCFKKILEFINNGSIEIVVEGLETLAQIMSKDQIVIKQMITNYHVLDIYKKYFNHIMLAVQIRVLWGISNIAGSQLFMILFQDKQMFNGLFQKAAPQNKIQLRMEAYFCILNLLSNSNNKILQQMCKNFPILQVLVHIFQQFSDPTIKSILLERTLYALYHLLSEYPYCWIKIQQSGIKKLLQSLYQGQIDPKKSLMIEQTIQTYEKCGKEIQNSFQKHS